MVANGFCLIFDFIFPKSALKLIFLHKNSLFLKFDSYCFDKFLMLKKMILLEFSHSLKKN